MNLLSDVITYIRRIIKVPNDSQIKDNLIIDYINRFWLMDVDARMQLFDLKTKYQFLTAPGVDQYNMPLYDVQTEPGGATIASFPVYQGFSAPARVNGITVPFYTQQGDFYDVWPNYVQSLPQIATGDGGATYTVNVPYFPLLQGHVDIAGIIATGVNQDPPNVSTLNLSVPTTSVYSAVYFTTTDAQGNNLIVADSGQFWEGNVGYGLLMRPGHAPTGNMALNGGYALPVNGNPTNLINYATGSATFTFTDANGLAADVPAGMPINASCYCIEQGMPRAILFYNNIITCRVPPNTQYVVELDCYLTPAAFLSSTGAIPFGYMCEYIARGAARKILADTGDREQFMFYEPLFKEQETLVWKRSQRQFTATRTQTIYSGGSQGQNNYNQSALGN